MSNIVVFAGAQASGKDTFANALHEKANEQNIKSVKVSFAASLKEELKELITNHLNEPEKTKNYLQNDLNLSNDETQTVLMLLSQINTPDTTSRSIPMRQLLQVWGTDIWRKRDENHWVNKTIDTMNNILKNNPNTLIYVTDARFHNELTALDNLGALLVALDIDEETRIKRIKERDGFEPTKESLNHPSEIEWKTYEKGYAIKIVTPDTPMTTPEAIANEILRRLNRSVKK